MVPQRQRSSRGLTVLALISSVGSFTILLSPHPLVAQASRPAESRLSAVDRGRLDQAVGKILEKHGEGIQVSLWLGGPAGEAWYEKEPGTPRPTASAIKTFFLIELFARYKDALDKPLPGLKEVVEDDQHPAISHFTPEQREEIRRDLKDASVRRVGEVMMGKTKLSNIVYNAAANVTTAVLGGPVKLTEAIHQRDPAFKGAVVRRYMLRDRKSPGDNEATAASMAALYQRLAAGRLAGIDAPTLKALRDVLFRARDPQRGSRFDKGGDLESDPLTVVHAGWWESDRGAVIYIVMAMQPAPGSRERPAAAAALSKTVRELEELLLSADSPGPQTRPAAAE